MKLKPFLFKDFFKLPTRTFFVFFLGVTLLWLVNHLSEVHQIAFSQNIKLVQLPDSLMLAQPSNLKVNINVKGTRIGFLKWYSKTPQVVLKGNDLENLNEKYFISEPSLIKAFSYSLPKSLTLLKANFIEVPIKKVAFKKVPIVPKYQFQFKPNYIAFQSPKLNYDSIVIKGPEAELKSIQFINTEMLFKNQLFENFETFMILDTNGLGENLILSADKVKAKFSIVKFGESSFKCDLMVKGVSDGQEIRLIPDKVNIVCKAPDDLLRSIVGSDFEIGVDFSNVDITKGNSLDLIVFKKPDGLISLKLDTYQVDYILSE